MEFEQIYTSFQPKIYHYIGKLVGYHEAEDLTQEVFAKVHKALNSFRNESQVSTWIYRIATNAAIDRMRNPIYQNNVMNQAALRQADLDEAKPQALCLSAKSLSLEDQAIHKEMNVCIQRIIHRLPENYRMVIILSEMEGFKDKEIADILGVSLETVKIRLHRGRSKLKKEFLCHCSFSWDARNELSCDPKNSDETILSKK